MSSAWLIALEMTGVLGVVIGFGVWELLSLRRDRLRSTKPPASERDISR